MKLKYHYKNFLLFKLYKLIYVMGSPGP